MTRAMNFDVTATSTAEREFLQIAAAADRLAQRLDALDRKRAEPTIQANITPATRSIAQLQTRLDALRNVRAAVQVDGAAEARRDVTALVVEMRKLRNARVRIDVDGNGVAQVTALAAQLRTLSRTVRARVELDDGTFARDIARLHQRISALSGSRVRIDFEINPPGIRAELEGIADALGRIRDTRIRVDADVGGASREVRRLGDALERVGKFGAIAISIPGAVSLLGQVGSLGSSLVGLTGVLGLVPAAGLAAGAGVAALAIGLNGLGDALGPTGTAAEIEKVNAAMARLSPAARELVTQIRALGPAWTDTRLGVQEQLLAGIGSQVQRLGGTYLPVLKTGLGGIATELNAGVRMWADWAGSAPAVNDLNTILGNTRTTLRELAPAGTNVAAALTDISVVGSEIMPELAAGTTAATARFREFVAQARETGQLEQWIRGGIDVMGQLGRITLNTGGILGSVFAASEEAGFSFLGTVEQLTGELDTLLSSTAGRTALVDVFRESREAVDAALPGIRELAGATLEMLANFARSDGLQRFAEWVSQTATAISPLVSRLGELAGDTLGALSGGASAAVTALTPVAGLIGGITDVLGPLVPVAVAAVIAFKGMAVLAAPLATLATTIAGLSIATGWGAASTAVMGFSTALTAVARALPLIGVAVIGLSFAMDGLTTSTSEAVDVMSRGGRAADELHASLLAQQQAMEQSTQRAQEFSTGLVDIGPNFDEISLSVKRWVQENILGIATLDSVNAAMAEQRASMTALERAQQDAAAAARDYQLAVEEFTVNSPQATSAAAELARATDRVELEQIAARNATDLHTAAMIQQSDQALAAVNANLGYEGALLNLERAQRTATEAVREHGAGSLEAREAEFALEQQHFRTAEAAGEKARADGIAAGASNVDRLAAQAQKDELLRLAEANSGPVRQSLLDAANAIDIQASAASRAESAARLHKDELGRLAAQTTGVLAEAIRGTISNFDQLGGAHATAQERARLQEQALRNLANMASGPVRTELLRMADQLRNIPDAEFDVTATGRGRFAGIPSGVSTPGRLASGGVWGGPGDVRRAATGAIMPGYTPGRDVHRFVSPTGGELHLSGGEPVMRPEFGLAVGHDWVHGANRAARLGGVAGVADFLHRTAPATERGRGEYRTGGIIPGPVPVQRHAFGGLVRLGIQPMSEVVNRAYIEARDRMADHLTPLMQARIREMERAAAAAALGSAGGGGGWRWQMNVLRQRFPGLQLISGFRPGAITATGNRSYHAQGRAVDVPPRMDVFNWIRGTYGGNTRELIFSPAGGRQVHNGRPHVYTGITRAQHYDHVHWAYRRGGIVPVGLGRHGRVMTGRLADRGGVVRDREVAVNLSGRAERMLSARQTESFDRLVGAIAGPRSPSAPAMPALRPTTGGMGDVGVLRRAIDRQTAEVRALAAVVADARPFVNNQTIVTADPVEAGRASVLGIRTGTRPRR